MHREDAFWAVEVPIRDGIEHAQGRTFAEAQMMAEGIVSIWAEELCDGELVRAWVTLAGDGRVKETVEMVRSAQSRAEEARTKARDAQIDAIAQLRAEGLTQQDMATVLGVTKGRISQLVNA